MANTITTRAHKVVNPPTIPPIAAVGAAGSADDADK